MRPTLCLLPLLAALAVPAAAQPAPLPDEVVAFAVHDAGIASVVKIDATGGEPPTRTPPGLEKFLPRQTGESRPERAVASGVLWDTAGHVVTTGALSREASFVVTLPDDTRRPARLLGTDADLGLSVLQVDGPLPGMRPVTPGPSRTLRVGQRLYAFGTAWGRSFLLLEGMLGGISEAYGDKGRALLLMTATVNPGNAGGAVFDTAGRFVGLIEGTYGTGGNANNGAITTVLQSDDMTGAVGQLIAKGRVEHPVLDIGVLNLQDDAQAAPLAATLPPGVGVLSTAADGAGARAGLRARDGDAVDVITAVDGVAVRHVSDLRAELDRRRPGDTCTLTVWRAGKTVKLPVTLGAAKH